MAHQHIIDHFYFASDAGKEGFIAEVPTGIGNELELFKVLAKVLNLPDYFGMNWDALDECLGDFHWIKDYRITLFHKDIPCLTECDLKIYLKVLARGMTDWKELDERKVQFPLHELKVIFPPDSMKFILKLLEEQIH